MFLDALKFRERPSVWEWAQNTLRMPLKVSPNSPGALSFEGQEYLREPLEALRNDSVSHIVLSFGAQVAKTTFCFTAFAYMRAHEPEPALWCLPTKDISKAFVRERFLPFVEANGWLVEGLPREAIGGLGIQFADANLSFVGVNSPGELSSRPVAWVVMDEAAKYEHKNKSEAPPDKLVEARTRTFVRKKIIECSTPSTAEHPFWQTFLQTSQKHYFVPCPHCGEKFELKFSERSLVWEHPANGEKVDLDTVRRTAHYLCPHCAGEIWERHKPAMMAGGEWRATNASADSQKLGYHLNSLYSRWMTWGEIAVGFVEAARRNDYQDFVNSTLAEPYTQYEVRVREEVVQKLCDKTYSRGTVPPGCKYLSVAYDCHQDLQYWAVCGHGHGGEQWVIDWGTVLGIEDIPAHAGGLEYEGQKVTLGFVDSGYNTQKVYDACAASGGLLWPTKGSEARTGTWTETMLREYRGLILYIYADHQQKTALYGERIARGGSPALHLPRDADEQLLRGLSGQELKRAAGAKWATWKRVAGDHLGDCVKLCAFTYQVAGRMFIESEQGNEEK